MCLKLIKKKIKALKGASDFVFVTLLFAKFLFGVGLGMLITIYWWGLEHEWGFYKTTMWGWIVLAIALIVHIPSMIEVYKKVWAK